MTALTVILAIAAGTYALRASMFVLVSSRPLPARADRALRLVGPAAVAALVAATTLAGHEGGARPPAELVAIGAAFLVVRRTGNVAHAFVAGLPAMWVLTPVLG